MPARHSQYTNESDLERRAPVQTSLEPSCMLPGPSKAVQWGDSACTVPLYELCLHSGARLIGLLRIP